MTAVVSFKSATDAYLASDTAHLNIDGTISHFAPKVFAMAQQNLVFATQGFSRAPEMIMQYLELDPRTARQTRWLEALPAALLRARECIRSHHPEREGSVLNEVHVWLALFCEQEKRPKLLTMTTSRMDYLPDLSPYQLAEHEGLVAPAVDVSALLPADWRGTPEEAASTVLEAQRRGTAPWGAHVHIVGGEGHLWGVSEHGLESAIVIRWPEKAGQRCDPKLKGRPPTRAAA